MFSKSFNTYFKLQIPIDDDKKSNVELTNRSQTTHIWCCYCFEERFSTKKLKMQKAFSFWYRSTFIIYDLCQNQNSYRSTYSHVNLLIVNIFKMISIFILDLQKATITHRDLYNILIFILMVYWDPKHVPLVCSFSVV